MKGKKEELMITNEKTQNFFALNNVVNNKDRGVFNEGDNMTIYN